MVKRIIEKAKAKYLRLMAMMSVAIMSTPLFTNPALAAGLGEIEGKITNGATAFTTFIKNVAVVTGGAAIALAFVLAFFTRDDGEVKQNIKWIKRILVCLIGIAACTTLATAAFTFIN